MNEMITWEKRLADPLAVILAVLRNVADVCDNRKSEAVRCANTERPLTTRIDRTDRSGFMKPTRCSEPGCDRGGQLARGMCKSHYNRWYRKNRILKEFDPADLARRLAAKVQPSNGCLLWTGKLNQDGYGKLTRGGSYETILAHRAAYELYVGPIPSGLEIDHLCHNRACVNPAHLEAVSHRTNVRRGFAPAAINARKTKCVRGHPFDADNTSVYHGKRYCLACRKLKNAS